MPFHNCADLCTRIHGGWIFRITNSIGEIGICAAFGHSIITGYGTIIRLMGVTSIDLSEICVKRLEAGAFAFSHSMRAAFESRAQTNHLQCTEPAIEHRIE